MSVVNPGFVETPMTKPMLENPEFNAYVNANIPLGQLAQAEDIAAAASYLASDAAIMVTGHSLVIDGGWTAH